jgi:hypothetical protein
VEFRIIIPLQWSHQAIDLKALNTPKRNFNKHGSLKKSVGHGHFVLVKLPFWDHPGLGASSASSGKSAGHQAISEN